MNRLRFKKAVVTLGLLIGTTCFIPMPIWANTHNYSLKIPSPFPNSMQSTKTYEGDGTRAYVNPNLNTIATTYFIGVSKDGIVSATNYISTGTTSRKYFTWKSGYGGAGQQYCLKAYPTVNGPYNAYTVSGIWND